jgi:hypothetical protein
VVTGDPLDDTIAALFALWDGAPELAYEVDGEAAQTVVVDGPLLDDQEARRFVQVGTGGMYVPVGGQSTGRLGYGGRTEVTVDVTSALTVWSGGTDVQAVRREAYEVLRAMDGLLARDRSLGDVVAQAQMTRHQYLPLQDAGGQGCAVRLELTVRAVATRFEEG